MQYVGTGGVDWDVARDTNGSALLEPGETRKVSDELAAQLVLHNDWKAPKNREKSLLEAAEQRRQEVAAAHAYDAQQYDAIAAREEEVENARLEAEHQAFKQARDEEEAQRAAAADEAGQEAAEQTASDQGGGA